MTQVRFQIDTWSSYVYENLFDDIKKEYLASAWEVVDARLEEEVDDNRLDFIRNSTRRLLKEEFKK